jgi:proline iminopeptidase
MDWRRRAGLAMVGGMTRTTVLAAFAVCLAATPARGAGIESGHVTADDGARLFYQKRGGGREVLILPLRFVVFDAFAPLARGRTLIAYDMRNRGRSQAISDPRRLTIENDVADLEAVRRHFGVERFSTIGYSYLGLMVVMYAIAHPERVERIVQIGPVPRRWDSEYPPELVAGDGDAVVDQAELARLRELRARGEHQKKPRAYCERQWRATRGRLVGNPALAVRIPSPCAMPNEWPVNFERHLEAHFVGSVQKLDLRVEDVKKVTVPVLTIHGRRDRNAPYGGGREWALTLPDARLITVDDAAHQVWLDAPWVIAAIDRFLGGAWPEQARTIRGS